MVLFILLQPAFAAGGGGGDDGSTINLLVGLILVAFAYLSAHFVVDRLQKKYLFVSGFEYIGLGIALSFMNIFKDSEEQFKPAVAFAVGWVGILYGLNGEIRKTINREGYEIRLAISEVLIVGLGIGAIATGFFQIVLHADPKESLQCGAMMGCAAAASSRSAVDIISARYQSVRSMLLPTLKNAAQLSNILAIISFGILVCFYHEGSGSPSTLAWVTLFIGFLMGGAFAAFLASESTENNRFLALTGIICFAAGAAFYLQLSVLAVTLFLGMVLANTRHGKGVEATLAGAQKPAILILMLFAGVLLKPVTLVYGVALCAIFFFFRILLKAVGGWIAFKGTSVRGDIFRGHLAQGEVALAIAISFRLLYDGGQIYDLAYMAVIVSVAISELIGPRFLRGLLVDAGEIQQDIPLSREA